MSLNYSTGYLVTQGSPLSLFVGRSHNDIYLYIYSSSDFSQRGYLSVSRKRLKVWIRSRVWGSGILLFLQSKGTLSRDIVVPFI